MAQLNEQGSIGLLLEFIQFSWPDDIKVMIEKRHYPRINLKAPVLVKLKDGEEVSVELDNISSSGLQFICDRESETQITPNGQWDPAEILVEIELPGVKVSEKFEAKCAVVTSRRVSFESFCIGLKFIDFMGDSYASLGRCIELAAENHS